MNPFYFSLVFFFFIKSIEPGLHFFFFIDLDTAEFMAVFVNNNLKCVKSGIFKYSIKQQKQQKKILKYLKQSVQDVLLKSALNNTN